MLENILAIIFGDSIASLQNKSGDAINLFKETIEKLNKVNTSIENEVKIKNNKLSKLENEKSILENLYEKNHNFIVKLENF
jgi:predicted nuclease with TOPRIM domain